MVTSNVLANEPSYIEAIGTMLTGFVDPSVARSFDIKAPTEDKVNGIQVT